MIRPLGTRPSSVWILTLFVASAGLIAGCAAEEPVEEPPATVEEPIEETPPLADSTAGAVSLMVAQQEPYGSYLTDGEGRALYMFTADTQNESSACADACAEAWPPLTAEGEPTAGGQEVQSEMLGTIQREDGSMQVTYNGWPLYYYQQDTEAGQVTGQNVSGFGGEWYLISPEGEQIEAEAGA